MFINIFFDIFNALIVISIFTKFKDDGMNSANQLPNDLLDILQNVIDGNEARADELKLVSSQVEPFQFQIQVDWLFSTNLKSDRIAGGKKSSNHYGDDEKDFLENRDRNIDIGENDRSIRQNFLKNLKNQRFESLKDSDETHNIYNLGTSSYYDDCGTCHGNGDVTCHKCRGHKRIQCYQCFGSGQVAATEKIQDFSKNETTYRKIWVTCDKCYGGGMITCNNCNGTGTEECGSCSGYGYFMNYLTATVIAEPEISYQVTSPIYQSQILNFLSKRTHGFLLKKIDFNNYRFSSPYTNVERVVYDGDSFVTEVKTDLRGHEHIAVSISNPPHPFIKPKLFDQLLSKQNKLIQKVLSDGKITKEEYLTVFKEFQKVPVLNAAMLEIARNRKSTKENTSIFIKKSCQYYISNDLANSLSLGINHKLDKLSPTYARKSWLLATISLGGIAFLYSEYITEDIDPKLGNISDAEYHVEEITACSHADFSCRINKNSIPNDIMGGATYILVLTITICLVFTIVSRVLCIITNRVLEAEYRQKPRNREPIIRLVVITAICFLIGSTYGYFAKQDGFLPGFNGQVFAPFRNLVTKEFSPVCSMISETEHEKIHSICNYLPVEEFSPFIPIDKNFSKQDSIVYIQKQLKTEGYNIENGSKWNKRTEKLTKELLKKYGYRGVQISDETGINPLVYYYQLRAQENEQNYYNQFKNNIFVRLFVDEDYAQKN